MPRISRAVAVGYPHHITQRGNYRQTVFESDEDFKQYLFWLKKYSDKYSLRIWAYCLMSNHVHYVAVPTNDDSMAKTFNVLHMMYSRYFNQKNGGNGHLWQGRFYSCVLDEPHVYAAVRYVENNPVRAKMVDKSEDYRWSSSGAHIHKKTDPILSADCYLTEKIGDWKEYLTEKEDSVMTGTIFQNTKTGRPCGDEKFVGLIEGIVGRKLGAMSVGRPRKAKK